MDNQKKLPVTHVLAELSYLEFYNSKRKLEIGAYRVIEHDGEVNYAIRGDYKIDWYSEDEYLNALQHASYCRRQDDFTFDDNDSEELMDSWDNTMISQEGERLADEISMADHDEFRRIDPHDLANDDDRIDDDHLIVEMAAPVKTLGELLREHWISEGRPHIEAGDLSEAEYENHKRELGTFNQRSSERLDQAMAEKQ